MPKDHTPGKPTTRRYSEQEKEAAVRLVRTLRAELGSEHGTVQRLASQLGYGVESVRMWVRRLERTVMTEPRHYVEHGEPTPTKQRQLHPAG